MALTTLRWSHRDFELDRYVDRFHRNDLGLLLSDRK
jgi:hypothetical protein